MSVSWAPRDALKLINEPNCSQATLLEPGAEITLFTSEARFSALRFAFSVSYCLKCKILMNERLCFEPVSSGIGFAEAER